MHKIHSVMFFRTSTALFVLLSLGNFYIFTLYKNDMRISWKYIERLQLFNYIHFESYRNSTYCVAFNLTTPKARFREDGLEPITLSTHLTSEFLAYVEEQAETYDGPISVALLIDRKSQTSIQFLLDLHRCNKMVGDKMSLHVVYPTSPFQTSCSPIRMTTEQMDCKDFTERYKNDFFSRVPFPFGIYPINVMRNIARLGSSSDLCIVADVEMIFSNNFSSEIKQVANEHLMQPNTSEIIVIRRFEIANKQKVPRTITDLKKMLDNKTAFEFHHAIFPLGHTIEALFFWFRESAKDKSATVWNINYKSSAWEPQMILHKSAPLSEERIPTRVRDQQALAYELCRANYSFLLASRVFNVHRGVKLRQTSMDQVVLRHQKRLAKRAVIKFKARLDQTYPDTIDTCGTFIAG